LKHYVRAAVASTPIIWAVGSTSAADLPLRPFASAAAAHEVSHRVGISIVGINSSARLAMATPPSEVRDRRVHEFLLWKERSAANGRAR
jgi:hypothetical protein